jgi:hypothetical protein
VTDHVWKRGDVLVLHSDGVRHKSGLDRRELTQDSAGAIAQRLLRQSGENKDDATVVVVKDMA